MTEENKKILSDEPRQAVEEMITVTEELIARIEIESNAIATNDGTAFTMNEENKEHVANIYEKASAEFHKRINQFKKVDKALIEQLNAAQESLKQTTNNNLKLLEKFEKNQKENKSEND